MSKFKTCFFLGINFIIYSSCGTLVPPTYLYGPALYGHDISYQPKPLSNDSVHHANYASISLSSGEAPNTFNSRDGIKSAQVNIGQGFTFNHLNLSYAAFGDAGTYNNQTILESGQANYFNTKSFGNIGGRFSVNTFLTSGNVDIRVIGFEMAYSHEFGDYAAYRKSVNGQSNYFINSQTDLVTLGGTTEVIWHSAQKPLQFGFRLFIGQTLGDNFYKNANMPSGNHLPISNPISLAYFMQVKRYFFIGEVSPTINGELRVGVRF
jgi:hypothetical protein